MENNILLYMLIGLVIGIVISLFVGVFRSWDLHGKTETYSAYFADYVNGGKDGKYKKKIRVPDGVVGFDFVNGCIEFEYEKEIDLKPYDKDNPKPFNYDEKSFSKSFLKGLDNQIKSESLKIEKSRKIFMDNLKLPEYFNIPETVIGIDFGSKDSICVSFKEENCLTVRQYDYNPALWDEEAILKTPDNSDRYYDGISTTFVPPNNWIGRIYRKTLLNFRSEASLAKYSDEKRNATLTGMFKLLNMIKNCPEYKEIKQ